MNIPPRPVERGPPGPRAPAPAPKPDPDNAGRFLRNGAKAKAGTNRAIAQEAWGRIATMLTYKTSRYGELARRNVAVHAPDRRGSGGSRGLCGHLPSARAVLDDYAMLWQAVHGRHPHLPVTALGQSCGGSVLAALLASGRATPERVAFCAPALGRQRARHGDHGLRGLRALRGTRHRPVTVKDEDYTGRTRYLTFMANDHAMVRQVTDGFRSVMAELEENCTSRAPGTGQGAPDAVYFVLARRRRHPAGGAPRARGQPCPAGLRSRRPVSPHASTGRSASRATPPGSAGAPRASSQRSAPP
ncbi:serine aminopeptidase domain-containing protein [Streptomyces gamaensis]|uniref:Serine aminopeptidase domain-containing protein n=1 Tax=Streptomyces gamaensis TaxID=1763542 RepID=A0ABW0Z8E0_9ACTN